ncbi:MAG: hypothetical protein K8R59_17595 [Thermoanaerobaculales bacterium]|nr:hypothetical protein [Thermoanaerobaculales bacterium]
MKRALILLTFCCLPYTAGAQTFTASLIGDSGTGFANFEINGDTIAYSIVTSGLDPAPTTATLSDGGNPLDLNAAFVSGSAFGSVDSQLAVDIVLEPEMWMLTVTNGADSLTGVLSGGDQAAGTTLVFAVAANVTGQTDTNFVTDARLVNLGGSNTTVTLDYYQSSSAGLTAPTATVEVTLGAGEQAVLNDIVAVTFDMAGTKGAVVATTDGDILGSMRIYNDQSDAGLGTFGQYVRGLSMDAAPTAGTMAFLSNEDVATGAGYRANIGWFNAGGTAVTVTFTANDTDGAQLGQTTFDVAPMAQEQFAVSAAKFFPSLNPYGDFYITYSVAGSDGLFVYASVVDNVNGDAIFIAAE